MFSSQTIFQITIRKTYMKTFRIFFDKQYALTVKISEESLMDSVSKFIVGETEDKKYFINKDNILYFYEFDEKKDKMLSKQF